MAFASFFPILDRLFSRGQYSTLPGESKGEKNPAHPLRGCAGFENSDLP